MVASPPRYSDVCLHPCLVPKSTSEGPGIFSELAQEAWSLDSVGSSPYLAS